jgi:chemotaxis protein MotA
MTAIIGLVSAFLILFTAMVIGGSPLGFVNLTGVLIVIFGTIAVTSISFSFEELKSIPRTLWHLMRRKLAPPNIAAETMMKIADKARKNGLLVLEKTLGSLRKQPFLEKSIRLVVDGTHGDDIERIMEREAGSITARNMKLVDILRRAGEVAPAMGLIGTLVGLVNMLGGLDNPESIGPDMAVALLTTFYGAILAHIVFIPLAARAERISEDEALLHSVYIIGAASIGRKENPRRLEDMVNAVLPPSEQIKYFR